MVFKSGAIGGSVASARFLIAMDINEILRFLQEQIHSVIVATVDENYLPVTCAVDRSER